MGWVGWLMYIMGIIIGTGADGLIGIEGDSIARLEWFCGSATIHGLSGDWRTRRRGGTRALSGLCPGRSLTGGRS